jgi:hypothetical protein
VGIQTSAIVSVVPWTTSVTRVTATAVKTTRPCPASGRPAAVVARGRPPATRPRAPRSRPQGTFPGRRSAACAGPDGGRRHGGGRAPSTATAGAWRSPRRRPATR